MTPRTVKSKSRITQKICQRIPDRRGCDFESPSARCTGQFVARDVRQSLEMSRRRDRQAVGFNSGGVRCTTVTEAVFTVHPNRRVCKSVADIAM